MVPIRLILTYVVSSFFNFPVPHPSTNKIMDSEGRTSSVNPETSNMFSTPTKTNIALHSPPASPSFSSNVFDDPSFSAPPSPIIPSDLARITPPVTPEEQQGQFQHVFNAPRKVDARLRLYQAQSIFTSAPVTTPTPAGSTFHSTQLSPLRGRRRSRQRLNFQ